MSIESLMGELKEFKRATIEWQARVEGKIDVLQSFRWRLLGASALASLIVSGIVELLIFHGK